MNERLWEIIFNGNPSFALPRFVPHLLSSDCCRGKGEKRERTARINNTSLTNDSRPKRAHWLSHKKVINWFPYHLDVIYIGSIVATHYEIGMMALENGKHVLCEKPLSINEKQSRRLFETAKAKNLFFMEVNGTLISWVTFAWLRGARELIYVCSLIVGKRKGLHSARNKWKFPNTAIKARRWNLWDCVQQNLLFHRHNVVGCD